MFGGRAEVRHQSVAGMKFGANLWPGGSPTSVGNRAEVWRQLVAGWKSDDGRGGVWGKRTVVSLSSMLGFPSMRNEGSIYNFLRVACPVNRREIKSKLGMADSEAKLLKTGKSIDENVESKVDVEATSGGNKLDQPSEPPKLDYIHVRARRGQATDSHSLAERARREKISERMKILQDLVPGCNKVIGKASVLDEIINYIQALQRQVEFLSMKLEAVDSRINTGLLEGFSSKDFGGQAYENVSSLAYASQPSREYVQRGPATEWLHMQVGGAFERVTN
ncbi:hypothetical protein IEQ34_011626 [Dendrobium chrysotoxum]|uniref:BHLH domain-containing protein n=1 Tax=Dendrobium chrysotoxum TaxID=161865 RepID=A0AAV7GRS6_DENCH|nr:hypothetical protein IEQ34_011626 [Dendrobium chrysotoxum]